MKTTSVPLLLSLLAWGTTAACGPSSGSSPPPDPDRIAATIAASTTSSRPGCRGEAPPPDLSGGAVVVTAELCLSCRNLGWMLRRLERHHTPCIEPIE